MTIGGVVYYHDYGSDGKRTLSDANKGKRNFDNDAWHFAGTMEWRIPESPWTIRTGVTYTDAKKRMVLVNLRVILLAILVDALTHPLTQILTMCVMVKLWGH